MICAQKNPFLYYGGKLVGFAVSLFLLSLAVFYVARLAPGDPLVSYYGDRAEKMTVQERARAEERLGLGTRARSRRGSGMGIAESSARVYGCRGSANTSLAGPTSTSFP